MKKKKEYSISEFKAHALRLVEGVSTTGEELIILKRGKPLARVIRYEEDGVVRKPGRLAHLLLEMGDVETGFGEDDWEACK